MPNIGYYHPIVIHFAIGFLVAGVVLRLLSLTGRVRFASPAAAALLLLGTLAAVASVRSGTDAHGPAERVPGARDAVVEHEEVGERARNVFLVVALLEIAALALARRKRERIALIASALVGIVGLYFLFEAAEHGGDLVYSYAGGIGIRTGEEEDVERLLLAGLYHQSQLDRKNGRSDEAAALIEMAARRHPGDAEVQLLAAESLILDRKAPEQALSSLARIDIPSADGRLRIRRGILEADAYQAAGDGAKARASIEALLSEFPDNARLKHRLEELAGR